MSVLTCPSLPKLWTQPELSWVPVCGRVEEEHEGRADVPLSLYWGVRMHTRVQEFQRSCGLEIAQSYFEFVAILASCGQKYALL